jgi:hypothetical protein
MKIVITLIIIFSLQMTAQSLAWKKTLIEPDLLVNFINDNKVIRDETITRYEFQNDEVILLITTEKSPLNYFGRSISDVDTEYFGSLTKSIITSNKKLLKESNFDFEGHNVRELVYSDVVNSKPCTVTLQILNVTGFEEAMYKFYFIDFKNRDIVPEKYTPFFSDWDLYFKIENDVKDSENANDVLKAKGFVIENEQKK